jgi:hypothetical protein
MKEAVEVSEHIKYIKYNSVDCAKYIIVMDLINTLPGNSSVNTVQHATVETKQGTILNYYELMARGHFGNQE